MKTLSGILIGVFLTSFFFLTAAQEISSQEVDIQYDMAGMTQVLIKDGRLKYIDSEYQGHDQTAAGSPEAYSRSSEGKAVTSGEIKALIKLFRSSGFFDLNDTYGTTPDDRHYPVRISIKTGSIEKSVYYLSHPNFPAPEAFQKVEAALLELAREKFKIQ
jgi:hypothetical protein